MQLEEKNTCTKGIVGLGFLFKLCLAFTGSSLMLPWPCFLLQENCRARGEWRLWCPSENPAFQKSLKQRFCNCTAKFLRRNLWGWKQIAHSISQDLAKGSASAWDSVGIWGFFNNDMGDFFFFYFVSWVAFVQLASEWNRFLLEAGTDVKLWFDPLMN